MLQSYHSSSLHRINAVVVLSDQPFLHPNLSHLVLLISTRLASILFISPTRFIGFNIFKRFDAGPNLILSSSSNALSHFIYFLSSNRAHAVKSMLKKYVQTHQKITHPLVFRVGRPV